jgi:hypothetical protein
VIVSTVVDSFIDETHRMAGVVVHVWGNLNVLVICDHRANMMTLFVLDKTKMPKTKPFAPFWSRLHTYEWAEFATKAIYYRSVANTKWHKLPDGVNRLNTYNYRRKHHETVADAYDEMWHLGVDLQIEEEDDNVKS